MIRQRERSRRIPVIFLTAYNKDETQVFRGYSEGAVDYVFKPVEPVILRAKVRVFIELSKQSEEIRLKAEQERRLLEENLRIRNEHMEAERQLRSTEKREAMVVRQLPIAVYEARVGHHGMLRSFLHDDSYLRAAEALR
jgi:response regulator RpfG family c-di-GMP phosphodiesterase